VKRSELLRIDEAARVLGRSVRQLRRWSIRGFAVNGMRFQTYRDKFTKIRYFSRADVERIAKAIEPVAA